MPRCPEKHESPPQECGGGEVVLYINRKARRHCLFRAEVKAKPTCQSSKCFYCVKSVKPQVIGFLQKCFGLWHAYLPVFSLCTCTYVPYWRQKSMLDVFLYFFLPTCVLCMCVLPACISACLVPLEVWMGLLGLEFEPPCRCWELNSGPLEEQSVIAEPSLSFSVWVRVLTEPGAHRFTGLLASHLQTFSFLSAPVLPLQTRVSTHSWN